MNPLFSSSISASNNTMEPSNHSVDAPSETTPSATYYNHSIDPYISQIAYYRQFCMNSQYQLNFVSPEYYSQAFQSFTDCHEYLIYLEHLSQNFKQSGQIICPNSFSDYLTFKYQNYTNNDQSHDSSEMKEDRIDSDYLTSEKNIYNEDTSDTFQNQSFLVSGNQEIFKETYFQNTKRDLVFDDKDACKDYRIDLQNLFEVWKTLNFSTTQKALKSYSLLHQNFGKLFGQVNNLIMYMQRNRNDLPGYFRSAFTAVNKYLNIQNSFDPITQFNKDSFFQNCVDLLNLHATIIHVGRKMSSLELVLDRFYRVYKALAFREITINKPSLESLTARYSVTKQVYNESSGCNASFKRGHISYLANLILRFNNQVDVSEELNLFNQNYTFKTIEMETAYFFNLTDTIDERLENINTGIENNFRDTLMEDMTNLLLGNITKEEILFKMQNHIKDFLFHAQNNEIFAAGYLAGLHLFFSKR